MIQYREVIKLAVSIGVCLGAGVLGAVFTAPAIPTWYAGLEKPSFAPPEWLFSPVWTALFVLMGVSVFLVWQRGLERPHVRIALGMFGVQLLLNMAWSAVFFGLKAPFAALIEILVLWAAIAVTIQKFLQVSRTAALLLVPYLLWVSFAALLNGFLWRLNA